MHLQEGPKEGHYIVYDRKFERRDEREKKSSIQRDTNQPLVLLKKINPADIKTFVNLKKHTRHNLT